MGCGKGVGAECMAGPGSLGPLSGVDDWVGGCGEVLDKSGSSVTRGLQPTLLPEDSCAWTKAKVLTSLCNRERETAGEKGCKKIAAQGKG